MRVDVKIFQEHSSKVMTGGDHFKHVMAITLDPRTGHHTGIVRCITKRTGDVAVKGFRDRSELHVITGESLEQFVIGERLHIRNEEPVITELTRDGGDFIGLEDPDIWIDEKTDLMHVYFTIPIAGKTDDPVQVSLGHAVGKALDLLEMTVPALKADGRRDSAKEVSIAPTNRQGVRLNLVESHDRLSDRGYSTVRVAIAEDMGEPWKYGKTVFHPAEHSIPWIVEDASPGPLFSRDFIDVGEGRLLGVINGRESSHRSDDETIYGMFSVGLFIYNYEEGAIEWVSPESLIRDSEARTITFASQFVTTGVGEGILYAHVDDSFVRAYSLYAEGIRTLLP